MWQIQRAAYGENRICPDFEYDVLALLVKLIEALAERLLGLVSGVKLPKTFYKTKTIQTVLQP